MVFTLNAYQMSDILSIKWIYRYTAHTQKIIEYTQIIELGNTSSITVRTKKKQKKIVLTNK